MATTTITALPTASGIDGSADWLAIDRTSLSTTQKINRNTLLGVTGQPMDISTAQNVTNKTLDNTNAITIKDTSFTLQDDGDTTKQAKFQLSGLTTATTRTYTLPDVTDTLVSLTATQTLTNKTLTAPVINNGSITGTTITTDAIVGQSAATNGTVYGLAITTSKISGTSITNATITSTQLATGAVAGANLATTAITLGQAQRTTDFTTASATLVDITSLSVTVTVPAGGRRIKISFGGIYALTSGGGGSGVDLSINDVTAGAEIGHLTFSQPTANYATNPYFFTTHVPASGSRTYKMQASTSAGTMTLHATATSPAFILVEAI